MLAGQHHPGAEIRGRLKGLNHRRQLDGPRARAQHDCYFHCTLGLLKSLHSDALRQVARLIYLEAPVGCDVIAQRLHRNHREQRAEQLIHSGHLQQHVE
jgi:hypothetical protein